MTKSILSYVGVLALGLLVATVGAGAHRAVPFLGVVLAVVMVLAATIFVRTWKSFAGLGVFALAWFGLTVLYAGEGPGGSELISADALGLTWAIGGSVAIVAASFVPRSVLVGREPVATVPVETETVGADDVAR